MPRTTKTAAGPARKSRAFSLPGISDKRSDVRNTPMTPTQRLDMLCRVIERLTLENDTLRAQVREMQGPADQAIELQQRVDQLRYSLEREQRDRREAERALRERAMREARDASQRILAGTEDPPWVRQAELTNAMIDPRMVVDGPLVANTITTMRNNQMYQYWTTTNAMPVYEDPQTQAQQPAPDEPNVGEQQG